MTACQMFQTRRAPVLKGHVDEKGCGGVKGSRSEWMSMESKCCATAQRASEGGDKAEEIADESETTWGVGVHEDGNRESR